MQCATNTCQRCGNEVSNRIRTVPLDLPNAAWFRKQRHHGEEKKDKSVPELIISITIKAAVELWQAGLFQNQGQHRRENGESVRVGWSQTGCNEESDARGEMCSP